MKRLMIGLAACYVFLSLSTLAQNAQSFSGEIMDSQCATLGGHMIMMQKGESTKDCTMRCVKIGGKYTLFDASSKTVYQLDDQKKAEQFAGAKVKVTGTFNATTKTIHVTDIKAAS